MKKIYLAITAGGDRFYTDQDNDLPLSYVSLVELELGYDTWEVYIVRLLEQALELNVYTRIAVQDVLIEVGV